MCCMHCNRREFLGLTAGALAGAALVGATSSAAGAAPSQWPDDYWNPERAFAARVKPLRVQPVLMYRVQERREAASWKSWGDVRTEEAATKEAERITKELDSLKARAGFPMEILPLVRVTSVEEAAKAHSAGADATIVYPATGSGDMLRACTPEQGGLIFVRHRSGATYYWYEALSVKHLRKLGQAPAPDLPRLSVDDVVVDDLDELLWRLRALSAVKNFLGARIVALGGPQGKYAPEAPKVAQDRYKLDIVDVSYDDLGKRIAAALADPKCMAQAERWAQAYANVPNTKISTEGAFITNAFVLYGLFKDILAEHEASIFTIQGCMGAVLPMSHTTACLTLGLMNDEGLLAFCESDFVVIPPGVLLFYVSGKPVFMHNSTFPHNGIVTCAHCTGPRRMDGARYEPVEILTHYESEYGAAPKVEIPVGQQVTFIDPEYATGRWLGLKGTVKGNPFLEICRSQQDVEIAGDWRKLLNEVRDSHWVMTYGDCLREAGYAAQRAGITWEAIV